MKPSYHPFKEVEIIAQIADLKDVDYKNTLIITAIVELLVAKGVLTRKEILQKAEDLEMELSLDGIALDNSRFTSS
ncbi:hypothetical protein J2Z37_002305 [Ammoniphilus resinae]|uniref:Uncharacterized protein n=1 Tax=Ammoniphilus resinae TaxID=861532 RepID=A0ABS4GPW4_9BACL|nr:hypothetical protein [Ammoniphilus resinae]